MAFKSLEDLIKKHGVKKNFISKKFGITEQAFSILIKFENVYLEIRKYLLKKKVD